jgi:hypothetical protein
MIQRKNVLAENMLRFGPKNLTKSQVASLRRIIEQSTRTSADYVEFLNRLNKIDPVAEDVVKNKKFGVTVGKNYVLNYVPGAGDSNSTGTLYIYKVASSRGLPYILLYGQVIHRGETSSVNDITINSPYTMQPDELLPTWDDLYDNTTQDVINGAFQFIQNNLATFKKAFHQVTRSGQNYINWWNDTPSTFKDSQYAMWRNKYKENAQQVINLVQDDLLIKNILFKTKNLRSDGKYPELTIPPAV